MVGMAAVGQLTYNNITFDGTSKINVRVEFVYDSSGRAVLYHKHTIVVEAVVGSASSTTDDDMEVIRAALSKPGKGLIFIQKGFGDDLIVNVTNGLMDVQFGPKPRVLEWHPIAGNAAANILWEVEVCIPVCNTAGNHRSTGIMSFTYDIDFAINKGWTTRTITGTIVIAMTRLNPGQGAAALIPDHADYYREQIRAGDIAPDGFERTSSWHTSEDKTTLTFTITDTQIRSNNPYPPGVVSIAVRHNPRWRRYNRGGMKLENTLSMTAELMPGASPITALFIFTNILGQKLAVARNAGKGVLLEEFEIEEDVYGMPVSASATWTVLRGIDEIVQSTGLFVTPEVNSPTWGFWNQSVKPSQMQRGFAGMRDFAANDAIVDLCTFVTPGVASTAPRPTNTTSDRRPQNLIYQRPPVNSSYSRAENWIYTNKAMPATRQSPQQMPYSGGQPQTTGGEQGSATPPNNSTSPYQQGFQFSPGERKTYDDTIQMSGGGNTTIVMMGSAERIGYEIPRPKLTQYGGLTVAAGQLVETDVHFATGCAAVIFGVPVYKAVWYITYMATNTPYFAPVPNNLEDGAQAWIG